jgi:hypothetical protein
MNVIADGADRGADAHRRFEERDGLRWRTARAIRVGNPMPAARGTDMLAQELTGRGIQQADEEVVPLHVDAPSDPARRGAVVRGLDLHAAIEVHGADAETVIAKRLEWEWAEGGSLLSKHGGDLTLRSAVDARVGPVGFPAIEIRLRLLQRFEAEAA